MQTVTTLMFSPYTTDVAAAPDGLSDAPALDYSITLTNFKRVVIRTRRRRRRVDAGVMAGTLAADA